MANESNSVHLRASRISEHLLCGLLHLVHGLCQLVVALAKFLKRQVCTRLHGLQAYLVLPVEILHLLAKLVVRCGSKSRDGNVVVIVVVALALLLAHLIQLRLQAAEIKKFEKLAEELRIQH